MKVIPWAQPKQAGTCTGQQVDRKMLEANLMKTTKAPSIWHERKQTQPFLYFIKRTTWTDNTKKYKYKAVLDSF